MKTNNRGVADLDTIGLCVLIFVVVGGGVFLVMWFVSPTTQSVSPAAESVHNPADEFSKSNVLWKTVLSYRSTALLVEMGDGHDYLLTDDRYREVRTMVHAAGCRACNPKVAKTEEVDATAK